MSATTVSSTLEIERQGPDASGHRPPSSLFRRSGFSRGKTEVLQQIMQYLYNNKVQSLIVEGGAITHQAFLDARLWDEIRVETLLSTSVENSVTSGTPAPMLPHNVRLISHEAYDGNIINTYERM